MEQPIEHEALEQDIIELTAEIKERSGGAVTAEALRETLHKKIYGSIPPEALRDAPPRSAESLESTKIKGPLPSYAKDASPEAKLMVEKLLDATLHNGLVPAIIKKVRKTDAYTMKLFHDAITEVYYDKLKQRGFLK